MRYRLLFVSLMLVAVCYGQTSNEVRKYLDSIGCKHADIVTAQAVLETGHFKSFSCRTRHNLFGLRYKHEYLIFDDWRGSCRAYISKVQYKYKGGDYYMFLSDLGYAADPEYVSKLKRIN